MWDTLLSPDPILGAAFRSDGVKGYSPLSGTSAWLEAAQSTVLMGRYLKIQLVTAPDGTLENH